MRFENSNLKLLIGMPDKDSWGGVQACEPPFVAALKDLGIDVTEETYVYGAKASRITLRERTTRVLRTAFKFRRILRAGNYDLVHLNTAFDLKTVLRDLTTLWLASSPRNAKIKFFLKLHGSENDLLLTKNRIKRFLWRQLLKKADGIGVLSSAEKHNFVTAGVAEKKIFTVKNAVRVPPHLSPRSFVDKPFRLLFVSRFIPSKGLLETINAVVKLRASGFDLVLNCLGDGELRGFAEQEVERRAARDYIRFHGYVPEEKVSEFYQQSDLLVFPTRHAEGFPMVIFNALAHGLPIVTTRIRAAADYLSEPENCLWTISSNDDENLRQQIGRLARDRELRRQMSENNRHLVEKFTPAKVALEFSEIYRQILKAE